MQNFLQGDAVPGISVDDLFEQVRGRDAAVREMLDAGVNPSHSVSLDDETALALYRIAKSDDGQKLLNHLADLTVRRLDPISLGNIEQAAMLAIAKQRDTQLFLSIASAVEHGKTLAEGEK